MKAATLEIQILTDIARLQKDMRAVQRTVDAANGEVTNSFNRAGASASKMAADVQKAAAAATGFGRQGKLAGHHVQNLAFQFQDLGVQMAMAAQSSAPLKMAMMALMQQGSQIQGIMSQAGIGIGGVAKELGTIALKFAPAIAAVGAFAAGFGVLTNEINKTAATQVTMTDTMLGTWDALKAELSGAVTGAFQAFGLSTKDVWGQVVNVTKWAINWIIGAASTVPRMIAATWDKIPAGFGDAFYSGANIAIDALNKLVQWAADGVNMVTGLFNKAFGTQIPAVTVGGIQRLENPYAGAMGRLASAGVKAFTDTTNRDFLGEASAKISPFAQDRARQRMDADAKKAGKSAGSKAGKEFVDEFAKAMEKLRYEILGMASAAAVDVYKKLGIDVDGDWAKMMDDLKQGTIDRTQGALDEVNARAAMNEQLKVTINLLDQMGLKGLGNFGAIGVGLSSGDFSGVRGKLGGMLGLADAMMGGNGAIKKALTDVFGENAGNIADPLNKALQGAGLGVAAGSIFVGSKGSKTGSGIGGALGGAAFEKFAGEGLKKALGAFGGPLASIAGGILGGGLGGLMKKTKTGAANITGMGAASLSGNSSGFKAAAGGAASSVQDGLAAIAQQLGGGVGGFNVTIGQRHGDWRVRTGAGSLKIKKGAKEFDDDEAGAIKYAISLAVQQGALTGLRAATQRLLKGGSDIEAQLQKALSFQAVFDELEQRTDPAAYALKQIGKEFEALTKIFQEAGASADEYAKLEELFSAKRKDAMTESVESLREFMASLSFGGNSPLSLRQQSASSLSALQPYLDSINAGKSIDQDKYLNAAQSYLDIQRQINGSGQGFFDAFEMIRSATNKAIGNAENVQALDLSAAETARHTADISNMMADQNDKLDRQNELLERIAAGGGGSAWIAQNRNYA